MNCLRLGCKWHSGGRQFDPVQLHNITSEFAAARRRFRFCGTIAERYSCGSALAESLEAAAMPPAAGALPPPIPPSRSSEVWSWATHGREPQRRRVTTRPPPSPASNEARASSAQSRMARRLVRRCELPPCAPNPANGFRTSVPTAASRQRAPAAAIATPAAPSSGDSPRVSSHPRPPVLAPRHPGLAPRGSGPTLQS